MKIIDFIATDKDFLDILPKPIPSCNNFPDWYKKTTSYIDNKKTIDMYSDPNSTIKKCIPVIDSLSMGYNIVLPCDLWIFNEGEDRIRFQWAMDGLELISEQKKEQYIEYPTPNGYYSTVFKFINQWITKTPNGYSSIFIHPLHHEDLPFKCIPAVVDTDKFPLPVNFPFFIKKDFNGLIPKGTPIIQILPFKREEFVSRYSWDKKSKFKNIWKKASLSFFDIYLKNFHSSKKFEQGDDKRISKCPFGW